jgi:hypothetical protein
VGTPRKKADWDLLEATPEQIPRENDHYSTQTSCTEIDNRSRFKRHGTPRFNPNL